MTISIKHDCLLLCTEKRGVGEHEHGEEEAGEDGLLPAPVPADADGDVLVLGHRLDADPPRPQLRGHCEQRHGLNIGNLWCSPRDLQSSSVLVKAQISTHSGELTIYVGKYVVFINKWQFLFSANRSNPYIIIK